MPEATTHPADPQLSTPITLAWGGDLGLEIHIGTDRVARLCAPVHVSGSLPLIEARFTGETRNWSADRSVRTAAGARLLYQGHEELCEGSWSRLRIDLADPDTGLAAELHLRRPDGIAALQAHVTLVNAGTRALVVETVSSFVLGGLAGRPTSEGDLLANLDLWLAENDWLAENRWRR